MMSRMDTPNINLFVTDSAARQIQLMQQNDYTLEGLCFRIKIGGKGCGGFTYDTGFSEPHADDLVVKKSYPNMGVHLEIHLDPFTAHYASNLTIDYLLDMDSNEEGFVVTNPEESNYRGKFFKDETKLPPWAKR